MNTKFLTLLLFAAVAVWTVPASAQGYKLSTTGGADDPGDTVTTTVDLSIDGADVSAFQFAVCFDGDLVSIEAGDIDQLSVLTDLNAGGGPDFAGVAVEDNSWRVSILVDLFNPDIGLAVGGDIYEATYSLDNVGTSALSFCGDGLPAPEEGASELAIINVDGDVVEPETTGSQLHVTGDWEFVIADAEGDYDPLDGTGDDVTTTICVSEDSVTASDNSALQGSVSHDATYLSIVSVDSFDATADMNDGNGPEYLGTELSPANGAGFTFAMIYNMDAIDPDVTIDFTGGGCSGVLEMTYSLVAADLIDEEGPIIVKLEWDDGLDDPGVPAAIVVEDADVTPNVYNGCIELAPPSGGEFLRSDADGNGIIFPIIDALYILEYGFTNGPVPPCLDAADADGNNVIFPIIDALFVLEYGFTNGPPPPDPGPTDCGPDPDGDDDGITCDDEETCP